MAAFVKVARVSDVPPGQMLSVHSQGQPVVLANVDGTIYALSGGAIASPKPPGMGTGMRGTWAMAT